MPCTIPYIPEYLHSNGRPVIEAFYINEFLFRRCSQGKKANPFDGISLVDLSVNRSGHADNLLSKPNDVLLNTDPANGKGQILNEEIVCLRIAELNEYGQYIKENSNEKDVNGTKITNTCLIHLKHKIEECNYAHCAFEIYFNGIEMTYKNYDKNLKKDTLLRTWCKLEIVKMIVREEVWINWPNENPSISNVSPEEIANDKT